MASLQHYIDVFSKLSTDKSKARWDDTTRYRAPHKPLLLLAMIDLFSEGIIEANLIELTPELGELFAIYWSKISPLDRRRGNIAMPYWHLQGDGFWHLIPNPGYESFVRTALQVRAISKLKETVLGAQLDSDLYALLCSEEYRNILRSVLTETYFSPTNQAILIEQSLININAFLYSQDLVNQVKNVTHIKEPATDSFSSKAVRDQGFRRAIVKAYDHRCAICGVRILTVDGHTAVVAAHIIPWSKSHNDDPRNGLALCHLCHWNFDEGLLSFSDSYHVKVSSQLSNAPNLPGHFSTFTDRSLIGPSDNDLWPFLDSIRWHRKNIFRTR